MNDIITVFPTAEDMLNGDSFELYLFEEELRNVFLSIARAQSYNQKKTIYSSLSNNVIDFLKGKGYSIKQNSTMNYEISWDYKDRKNTVKNIDTGDLPF